MISRTPLITLKSTAQNGPNTPKNPSRLWIFIFKRQKEPPIAQLVSTAEPALTMSLEFEFLKSQEMWKDFPDHELDEEFDKLIRQIKKRKLSAQLASLEYDIRSAEKEKNKERLAVLVAEFSKISKQL